MSASPETSNADAYLGTVIDFTLSSEDTGSSLTVLYQNVRIFIYISLDNLKQSSSIMEQYMAYLEIARNGGSGDFVGPTVEDFLRGSFEGAPHGSPSSQARWTIRQHHFMTVSIPRLSTSRCMQTRATNSYS